MSIYLPEWLGGYDAFLMYADVCWKPQIKLSYNPDDAERVVCAVAFFDVGSIAELIKFLGSGTGKEFLERFNKASSAIFKLLHMDQFLNLHLSELIDENSSDLEKCEKELVRRFIRHIIDFEFWNKIDVVELYANLIFYGTLEYPNPYVFFVPPMKEWKDYPESWLGYLPGD